MSWFKLLFVLSVNRQRLKMRITYVVQLADVGTILEIDG